ncbi:hypothetical protein DA802_21010, partial [Shouchella clausii]
MVFGTGINRELLNKICGCSLVVKPQLRAKHPWIVSELPRRISIIEYASRGRGMMFGTGINGKLHNII